MSVFCFYCNCEIFKGSRQHARKFPKHTWDHIIPKSRTGRGQRGTIVPACLWCNSQKGNLTIEEYRVLLAFRYGWISNIPYKFPGV